MRTTREIPSLFSSLWRTLKGLDDKPLVEPPFKRRTTTK